MRKEALSWGSQKSWEGFKDKSHLNFLKRRTPQLASVLDTAKGTLKTHGPTPSL